MSFEKTMQTFQFLEIQDNQARNMSDALPVIVLKHAYLCIIIYDPTLVSTFVKCDTISGGKKRSSDADQAFAEAQILYLSGLPAQAG